MPEGHEKVAVYVVIRRRRRYRLSSDRMHSSYLSWASHFVLALLWEGTVVSKVDVLSHERFPAISAQRLWLLASSTAGAVQLATNHLCTSSHPCFCDHDERTISTQKAELYGLYHIVRWSYGDSTDASPAFIDLDSSQPRFGTVCSSDGQADDSFLWLFFIWISSSRLCDVGRRGAGRRGGCTKRKPGPSRRRGDGRWASWTERLLATDTFTPYFSARWMEDEKYGDMGRRRSWPVGRMEA